MIGSEYLTSQGRGCYSRITTVALRPILWIVASLICGITITTNYAYAFAPSRPPGVIVLALAVQPDGRILVGGSYSREDSEARTSSFIVRLNEDGSLDLDYGLDNIKYGILSMQPDGKILVVLKETRNSFGEVVTPEIITRLNTDGSIDKTFSANPDSIGINTIAIQPDGKILIGSRALASRNSPSKQTSPNNAIYRLNTDGRIDKTFNRIVLEGRDSSSIQNIYVQADGKILIGGHFNNINGHARTNIARLNADGSLDTGFEPNVLYYRNHFPDAMAVQSDGKILFFGLCSQHDSQTTYPFIRVNPDGICDTSFKPDSNDIAGRSIIIRPDGKILVGGEIGLSRLDSNGDEDISFKAPYLIVDDIAVQDDEKILVGGAFRFLETQNGYQYRNLQGLVRLNADGSVDETFKPWTDNLIKPIASSNSSN